MRHLKLSTSSSETSATSGSTSSSSPRGIAKKEPRNPIAKKQPRKDLIKSCRAPANAFQTEPVAEDNYGEEDDDFEDQDGQEGLKRPLKVN